MSIIEGIKLLTGSKEDISKCLEWCKQCYQISPKWGLYIQSKILDKLLPEKARDKELVIEGMNLDGLSGGDLKNVVLNAAGIAAKANSLKISKEHIEGAIQMVKKAKGKTDDKEETRYIS